MYDVVHLVRDVAHAHDGGVKGLGMDLTPCMMLHTLCVMLRIYMVEVWKRPWAWT